MYFLNLFEKNEVTVFQNIMLYSSVDSNQILEWITRESCTVRFIPSSLSLLHIQTV